MAPYLCSPTLVDGAGASWSYNLTTLYTASGYSVGDGGGGNGTVDFNVCGYAAATCTPAISVQANVGVAVRNYGGSPPSPSAQCYTVNGTQVPCTGACDTLAVNAPVATLLDASNGGGGVSLQFQDTWPLADEAVQCPSDPVTGVVGPFTLAINIACDPGTPPTQLAGVAFATAAPCSFVITGKSGAGCGAKAA